MTKEQISIQLFHHCSMNNCTAVRKLLETYPDEINITENNGLYFDLAMSYDYIEMLKVLLDFYTENRLQCERDSKEFSDAQSELCQILEEGLDSNDVSSTMHILINKYLLYDAYSDTDNTHVSYAESDEEDPSSYDSESFLTEQNLKEWNESSGPRASMNNLESLIKPEEKNIDLSGQIYDVNVVG